MIKKEITTISAAQIRSEMNEIFMESPEKYKELHGKKFIPLEGEGGVLELVEEFVSDLQSGVRRCNYEGFSWEQMCLNRILKYEQIKSQLEGKKDE